MKVLRIYADTNVIGGCCDDEFAQWSLGLLKDFEIGYYRPVISEIVAAEIARAPVEVIEKYAELLDCNPEFAEVTAEVEELAAVYQEKKILSPNFSNDALHVALAAVVEVDALASWNFRHVVHMDKVRLFNAVNLERGYKPIHICSPREITYHGYQDS